MALGQLLFKPTEMQVEMPHFLETATDLAQKIIVKVMQYRRISGSKKSCAISICRACIEPHLQQVISAIEEQKPIRFLLPAFPAKSPNLAKVLGTLPDMAERLALEFLHNLCKQIQEIYSPGARVILCSDGRVFNDVVGIGDSDVTDYQHEIALLIKEMSLTSISLFNLDDVYRGQAFDEMRDQLMTQYGESLEVLKNAVRQGSKTLCSIDNEEVNRQYRGITRFLVEDAMHPEETNSRTAIQKECRQRAYIVIQRSRAWSDLIAMYFPDAVRLSIHPQTCGSTKLGIRLMEAESWMTPWHGVAVDRGGNFVLLKRAQAEELGAQLVYREGKLSHYALIDKQDYSKLEGGLYAT